MKEARFWAGEGDRIRCSLCRFRCLIPSGGRGICGVRENIGGILYTLVYGKSIADHVDPVEKKPLFHFLPGSRTFSIATVGCNFRCLHCQNYSISQPAGEQLAILGTELPPEEVVRRAQAAGCSSIAYTYTEPTIYLEYALDTARLAQSKGIRNVFVTNGYMTGEALRETAPLIDAANIDLKGFSEKFYREVVHAMLPDVLDGIVAYRKAGIWVEVTTLVIPGLNDSEEDLRGIARFLVKHVGAEVPWHVTGFHPTYRLQHLPRTRISSLRLGREIGLAEGLHHVYTGNLPEEGGEDTSCVSCGLVVVSRGGFAVRENRLKDGYCPRCGVAAAGIWS